MPYKCEKIRLGEEYDRRIKLTQEQKAEIIAKYKTGEFSQRELAEEYGVSRSLIGLITNPERMDKVKQRMKEHWRDYSFKEKRRVAMKNTRRYKYSLYKEGKI